MPLPNQFSRGLYRGNIGVEGILQGTAKWRPAVIHALENHPMTADELISHLLAEYHSNIDEELNFILNVLDDLNNVGNLQIHRVVFNLNTKKVDTYLTARFFSASKVY